MLRKGEQTAKKNERDYPYLVEIAVPENGFGNRLDVMATFHTELGIEPHMGCGRYAEPHHYVRWCFADQDHAESFARAFGGNVIPS